MNINILFIIAVAAIVGTTTLEASQDRTHEHGHDNASMQMPAGNPWKPGNERK